MPQAASLTSDEQRALRAAVDGAGLRQTAAWLGISRETAARAASGLAIRRGSVLLIRSRMGGGITTGAAYAP
jgi:hypothetical protein